MTKIARLYVTLWVATHVSLVLGVGPLIDLSIPDTHLLSAIISFFIVLIIKMLFESRLTEWLEQDDY